MNLYDEGELKRIKEVQDKNHKMEEFFKDKRIEWNEIVEPLFQVLKIQMNNTSSKKVLEAQSLALVYRQQINEQINYFLNKRSKELTKFKKLKQDKFVFYATGFGVKTNMSEKSILIDGHLAENTRSMELIESYIDFLRDTSKNLESFSYSIKNMIELINYLGT
jgi:hypothetical protein